jgi:hypothetical protein
MPNEKKLRIKDMYSAAVLRCLKYPLLDLEKSEEKHFFFVFDDSQNTAEKVVQEHWDGNLLVNSRDFVESVRELKTRLNMYNRDWA